MSLDESRKMIKEKFHDMFMDMIDSAPMSIVIVDDQSKIEYVNSYFSQLTGYSFDEALGQNPSLLKTGQTPPAVYKELWAHLKEGKSWKGEFVNKKKNGETYIEIASIFPVFDKNGSLHYFAFKIDGTEQKQMQVLVNVDPLTTLHNRFYLNKSLQSDLDNCIQHHQPMSVLFIDLDYFKQVNDLHGHAIGDQLLRAVGEMMRAHIRTEDGWVARYGGDEFVVCLPGIESDVAYTIAERLRYMLDSQPIRCEGIDISISCSIGVHTASGEDEPCTADDLVRAADKKLYLAKKSGRNLVVS